MVHIALTETVYLPLFFIFTDNGKLNKSPLLLTDPRHAVPQTHRVVHRIRAIFFCERVINPWNNLLSNTDFSSLTALKRSVSKAYFTYYLKRC